MVAALSPADINYDETLSTLRYVLQGPWVKNTSFHGPANSTRKRVFFWGASSRNSEASSNCAGCLWDL